MNFKRPGHHESFMFTKQGERVLLHNDNGNVIFDGSHFLFMECIKKGHFIQHSTEKVELSIFPNDRDPKWRGFTIKVNPKIKPLMEIIISDVSMTITNYQKLADILADYIE